MINMLYAPPNNMMYKNFDPHPIIDKMDTFKGLPFLDNNSCDIILTDPMYTLDEEQKDWLLTQFTRIASDWVIIFMPPENQFKKGKDERWVQYQEGFWIKPMSSKNTSKSYARYVETIQIYKLHHEAYWGHDRHYSQYVNVFTDKVDRTDLHAWRKPPSMIETLMLNHSVSDGKVFDPFAGSGVVGEVAMRNKRWYLLWDIEAENINLHRKNILD